jgi:hypothetical protein
VTILADPPLRVDGKCVECRKPRHPERSQKYAKAAAQADVFCSTACCRAWHEREQQRASEPRPITPREWRRAENAALALEPGGAFERFGS